MTARLRSWWKHLQKDRKALGIVASVLIVIGVLAWTIAVVRVNGTGFDGYTKVSTTTETTASPPTITRTQEYQPGKTLWDWLQLLAALAVPVVVGFGATWFTAQQGKVSARENTDNQRETALQTYIDKLSELLLKEHLGEVTPEGKVKPEYEEVRKIARVRTLTVLGGLDAVRKGSVLRFLHESGLITGGEPIIDLQGANLSGADLQGANLGKANLRRTDLSHANLAWAGLIGVDLTNANLRGANLNGANVQQFEMMRTLLSVEQARHTLTTKVIAAMNPAGAKSGLSAALDAFRGFSDSTIAPILERFPSQTDLSSADLREANLSGAYLSESNLSYSKLSGADLTGTILTKATLEAAIGTTSDQLKKAKSLQGATLPDGSQNP